ncbi:hypothetical protein [Clostridium tertium]|uniref:hypothetical protein n=1 Tax=Clostridium tertium TaxID=1559 RepID=UPI003520610C
MNEDFKGITVKQLKEFLNKYDDNSEVVVYVFNEDSPVRSIKEFTYHYYNNDEKVKGIIIN